MLITEWNTEDAKEVWREEKAMKIAQDALKKRPPIEAIYDITGLDIEVIRGIHTGRY